MANTTINIVDTDTLANLQANEPYNADNTHQLFYASDTEELYRIDSNGNLENVKDGNGVFSGSGLIPAGTVVGGLHRAADSTQRTNFVFGFDLGNGNHSTAFASQADDGLFTFGHEIDSSSGATQRVYLTLQSGLEVVNLEHDKIEFTDGSGIFGIDFSSGSPQWITGVDRVAIPNTQPGSNDSVWTVDTDGTGSWTVIPAASAAQTLGLSGSADPSLTLSGGGGSVDVTGVSGISVNNSGGTIVISSSYINGLDWSTQPAYQTVDMDGNRIENLVAGTASGEAVEYDQLIAATTTQQVNDFVYYTFGPNTYTPPNSYGTSMIFLNNGAGITTLGTAQYDNQVIRIYYDHLSNSDASPKEITWNSGLQSRLIHPGEVLEFISSGITYRDIRVNQPLHTQVKTGSVTSGTLTINPGLGEVYEIDAATSGAGNITVTINNDQVISSVDSDNSLQEKDYFFVNILNADVNSVTFEVDNGDGEGKQLYYSSFNGVLAETFDSPNIQLKFVKRGSTGADAGYEIYASTNGQINTINSITTGEPSGSDQVVNIVSLTQAEYDAGTPISTTFYIITDA